MKAYLQNKTVGFYLTVLATILAVFGLIQYSSAENTMSVVFTLVGIAIAAEVVLIAVSALAGNKPVLDLMSSVSAVLMAAALSVSFYSQVDAIGYVVSGLYTPDKIMQFAFFAGFAAAAMLLYIIASYMKLSKR